MPNIIGSSVLVIGGADFIGSHAVEVLLNHGVNRIVVYDNFCRGSFENLNSALKDPRVSILKLAEISVDQIY